MIKKSNFDKRFYEELIKASDKFSDVHIDGETLYCVTKKKITRKNFVEWCLKEVEKSIHMQDVIDSISDELKINILQNTVIYIY